MTCRVCGRSFQARRADLIRGRGQLCSRRCSALRALRLKSSPVAPPGSAPTADASHPLPATLEPRTEAQEP